MSQIVVNRPNSVRVMGIEDDPSTRKRLYRIISEQEGFECVGIASKYREYVDAVRSQEFDVASIDWEVDKVEAGPDALILAERLQPAAARILYTMHHEVQGVPMDVLPDFFVFKGAEDEQQYAEAVLLSAQLSMSRRIHALLRNLGSANLPELPKAGPIDEESDTRLYRCAMQQMECMSSTDIQTEQLLEMMSKRGWWIDPCSEDSIHLSDNELSFYVSEEIGQISSEVIEGHLSVCPPCRLKVESVVLDGGGRAGRYLLGRRTSMRVIESYQGYVERVENSIAHLSMVDSSGYEVEAEYDAGTLASQKIHQGYYFTCMITERDGKVSVEFRREINPRLSYQNRVQVAKSTKRALRTGTGSKRVFGPGEWERMLDEVDQLRNPRGPSA